MDWYPAHYRPDQGWPMAVFTTMPDHVRLVDIAAPRLKHERAKFWRKARDKALAEWEVTFELGETVSGGDAYGCDGITLDIADAPEGIGGWADHETPPCSDCECAWAWVDLQMWEQVWLSKVSGHLRYLIGHEIGHTLGFGHGGDGIMDPDPEGYPHVNDEELEALRSFWGTP